MSSRGVCNRRKAYEEYAVVITLGYAVPRRGHRIVVAFIRIGHQNTYKFPPEVVEGVRSAQSRA